MDLITLHPKLVHFPIAIIFLAVFFEGLYLWRKEEFFARVSLWTIYLGALSAALTIGSGLLAADSLGHDAPGHERVHDHRNLMYAAGAVWLILSLALFKLSFLKTASGRKLVLPVLFVIAGLVTYGADIGGELVYEYGTGVKSKAKTDGHGSKSSGHSHGEKSGEKSGGGHSHGDDHDDDHTGDSHGNKDSGGDSGHKDDGHSH